MGAAGTDVAMETADIALMADQLAKLPAAIALARKAAGIIRQDIALSLAAIAANGLRLLRRSSRQPPVLPRTSPSPDRAGIQLASS